jgi:hypothetical protein
MSDSINIWFFGDSFCSQNKNWVKLVSEKLNASISNLGHGGSSVDFLLDDILSKKHKITSNDYVIVCITDGERHFFRNYHLHAYHVSSHFRFRDHNFHTGIHPKVVEAYRTYVNELLNYEHLGRESAIKINHIINDILPNLNTKKVIYFNSMNDNNSSYEYFNSPQKVECPPFWTMFVDYLSKKYRDEIMELPEDELQDFIIGKLDTPNHWVDNSAQFHNYFFQRANPVLALIDAQIPLQLLI